MMKSYLLLICVFTLSLSFAAKPTIPASQVNVSNKTCTGMTLNWTNGDGYARTVFIREDSMVNFSPKDSTFYSSNNVFMGSAEYPNKGGGNYVIYSAKGNTVQIFNLKPGHKYYFSIVESNDFLYPQFLSSKPTTFVESTYNIQYNFTAVPIDSCERNNLFRITNTSKSDVPNIKYRYTFGDNSSSDSNNLFKHINGFGLKTVQIQATNAPAGCPANLSKILKIFPRKVVNLDFSKLKNDTQYYDGNYFEVRTTPISGPFPMSVYYNWEFEKDSFSAFPHMRYSYQHEGVFDVKLITTIHVNTKATGCKDTLTFRLVVLHDPFLNAIVSPRVHKLDSNLFTYTNIDSSVTKQIWYFGDGDSSLNASTQHTYAAIGTYNSKLYVETNFGYKGTKTFPVYVLNNDFNFSQFSIRKISDLFKSNMHTFSHKESLAQKQTWYFGDGDSSNLDSCSHRYQTPGIFNGYLKCTLIGGTVYTKKFQIEIIDDAKSILDNVSSNLIIYPNPANTQITIEIPEDSKYQVLRIFNALGESVFMLPQLEKSNTINLKNIPSGIYIIELIDKDGSGVRRSLVVNN